MSLQVTGVSISPGRDQLLVIHSNRGNDLVITLKTRNNEDRVGELVGVLTSRYFQSVYFSLFKTNTFFFEAKLQAFFLKTVLV